MVDEKKIAMLPAVELFYLKPEEQAMLVTTIDYEQTTPSLSQAQCMKKQSQEGTLTEDSMLAILCEKMLLYNPESCILLLSGIEFCTYILDEISAWENF